MIAVIAAAWYWHESSLRQSTDDAYVNAKIVQVSSLVMGQVVKVPIHDNEYVHKGDALFEIDRRPFEAALAEYRKLPANERHRSFDAAFAGGLNPTSGGGQDAGAKWQRRCRSGDNRRPAPGCWPFPVSL